MATLIDLYLLSGFALAWWLWSGVKTTMAKDARRVFGAIAIVSCIRVGFDLWVVESQNWHGMTYRAVIGTTGWYLVLRQVVGWQDDA